MSSHKRTFPPCGIYLRIHDISDKMKVLKNLREVAMVINRSSEYEQNMHLIAFDYDAENLASLRELVEAVRMSGLVAVVTGGVEALQSSGADGVLAKDRSQIGHLRAQLGEDIIIGLDACSEEWDSVKGTGVDFVILNMDIAKISMCAMTSEILCVVSGNIDNDNCGDYAALGASFVDSSQYIFSHKKGVMQGTVNILYALEHAFKDTPLKN